LSVCQRPLRASPAPAVAMSAVDRRQMLGLITGAAAATFSGALPAIAGEKDPYALSKKYEEDAKKMVEDMKAVTALKRGDPDFEKMVMGTRREMNEFVAFYRRNTRISGFPSYNTLYTAINTLSGHFASYGNKYPVPEKRKKRLVQQYAEIDRALLRGR